MLDVESPSTLTTGEEIPLIAISKLEETANACLLQATVSKISVAEVICDLLGVVGRKIYLNGTYTSTGNKIHLRFTNSSEFKFLLSLCGISFKEIYEACFKEPNKYGLSVKNMLKDSYLQEANILILQEILCL